MNTYEKMRRSLRDRKLKHMISGRELSAADITKAVDTLIGWARRDEAEGVRKDLILFDFEARFEEISDEIVADSYMPLYLFILYRYANALLGTGEAHRATELFDKLCEGTERLIGITNTYGIHCLEKLAAAAEADGQHKKALAAMESMKRISEEEFGTDSAVAIAVRRFCGRMAAQSA